MKNYCLLSLFCLALCACGNHTKPEEEDDTEESVEFVMPEIVSPVTIETLHRRDFHHELISNGKLAAQKTADLRFETSELIEEIFVKNGDRVRKGQPIATLNKFRLTHRREQAKVSLTQSKLDMQDLLIGQGYAIEDSLLVPEATRELVGIKSGHTNSQSNYELALREEKNATLVAPFDGIVANLFSKPYNMASTGEAFCTIIDTRNLEVSFTVLESELPLIKTGDRVEIAAFSVPDTECIGRISEINPVVDDNGMVKVKAAVQNNGKLFEGMNVRIKIQRSLPGQLTIPKTALVLRSGRQVVFTLNEEDKTARWNYIETGLENSTHYTLVGDELKEGDIIITSGNINLAHEAPVVIIDN